MAKSPTIGLTIVGRQKSRSHAKRAQSSMHEIARNLSINGLCTSGSHQTSKQEPRLRAASTDCCRDWKMFKVQKTFKMRARKCEQSRLCGSHITIAAARMKQALMWVRTQISC